MPSLTPNYWSGHFVAKAFEMYIFQGCLKCITKKLNKNICNKIVIIHVYNTCFYQINGASGDFQMTSGKGIIAITIGKSETMW